MTRSTRRELAFLLLNQLLKWAPSSAIPLRDDFSDALAVVDAVHEWRHGDGPMEDIVAAHDEYEAGQ